MPRLDARKAGNATIASLFPAFSRMAAWISVGAQRTLVRVPCNCTNSPPMTDEAMQVPFV